MRKANDIKEEWNKAEGKKRAGLSFAVIVELLLDIRELMIFNSRDKIMKEKKGERS